MKQKTKSKKLSSNPPQKKTRKPSTTTPKSLNKTKENPLLPPPTKNQETTSPFSKPTRLQKILAGLGLASRRESESWIEAGRLTVNGQPAVLGSLAALGSDEILLDGKPLSVPAHISVGKIYWAFHKPDQTLTSRRSQNGMPTIYDVPSLKKAPTILNPVGRLDYRTEGLLILTNDGDLSFRLMHPKYAVERLYHVVTASPVSLSLLTELRRKQGWTLDDGFVEVHLRVVDAGVYEVRLREGRNRVVRRLFEALGTTVIRLVRMSYGGVLLGQLPPGATRVLTQREVEHLKRSVDL